jgi:uncharacterized membrane protein
MPSKRRLSEYKPDTSVDSFCTSERYYVITVELDTLVIWSVIMERGVVPMLYECAFSAVGYIGMKTGLQVQFADCQSA